MKNLRTFESFCLMENYETINPSWEKKFLDWANKTENPELAKSLMTDFWRQKENKKMSDKEDKYKFPVRDFMAYTNKQAQKANVSGPAALMKQILDELHDSKSSDRSGFYTSNPGKSMKRYNLGEY